MPTDVGGRYAEYCDTIRGPTRARVNVRTPLAGAVAPSRKCCFRMNGSHRSRTSPVVWLTAKATFGGTGTRTLATTWGTPPASPITASVNPGGVVRRGVRPLRISW
jgi:hypothetical protein